MSTNFKGLRAQVSQFVYIQCQVVAHNIGSLPDQNQASSNGEVTYVTLA